jgi:hypothetical protein
MSIQSKWRHLNQILKLPTGEKRILVAGAVVLPCSVIGLRMFGFKGWSIRLQQWVRLCHWRQIGINETRSIRRTLQLMRLVIRLAPHRGNCLSQSLTLWWLLQCQGIESELRIGVRGAGDQFQAHAWIEYQGTPLNEIQDVQSRFTTFAEPMPVEMPTGLGNFAMSKDKAA